jgi:hypothetical protein
MVRTMDTSENFRFLVTRRGRNATLVQDNLSAYDPTTGTYSSSSVPDEYTVKTYMADYKLEEVDGNTVVLGDRKAIMATVDTTGIAFPKPSVGDKIEGIGDTVKVVDVQEIFNSTTTVAYICQVRE